MGQKWYAVFIGTQPGIYKTWAECKLQTHGVSCAEFKSFTSEAAAIAWLKEKETTHMLPQAPTNLAPTEKTAIKRDRSKTPEPTIKRDRSTSQGN
jgi:ribonuclease HI